MVENLDAHLAAMRVAGEHQVDAKLGGAGKRIGIVRQENVGHAGAHERRGVVQHRKTAAVKTASELVIDAD